MRKTLHAALIAAVFAAATATAGAADQPAYIGQHASTPEDTQAINKVIDDFKAAIKTRDVQLLTSLMMNENLLWASPPPPQVMKAFLQKHPEVKGFPEGAFQGFRGFRDFIASSKVPVEEKFYNVRITQDANLAWVMFDYEFVEGGRTTNYGVETWQMMKDADGQWKIASVFWSTHLMN
jgi:ketosteroid isomerase-like protein